MFIPPLLVLLLAACSLRLTTAAPAIPDPELALEAATQPPAHTRRIVDGTGVEDAARFPFLGAMVLANGRFHGCGGAILSETKIVTAAHCLPPEKPGAQPFGFRVGSIQLRSGGVLVHAKSWKTHPRRKAESKFDFDVGIVTLAPPGLTFDAPTIQPARLVASGAPMGKGRALELAGWGNLDPTQTTARPPKMLRRAELETIDIAACRKAHEKDDVAVTDRMFCTAAGTARACKGDSGGPVVDRTTKEPVLVGLVSWTWDQGMGKYPGVQTNLADKEIHSWIMGELDKP